MSKSKSVKPEHVPLSKSIAARIVKVWTDSTSALSVFGGELVEKIAREAAQSLDSDYVLTTEDAHALSAQAAKVTGWKKDKHGKWGARASEIKAIVDARRALPGAIRDLRAKQNACTWNEALSLARYINGGKSAASAVREVASARKNGGASEPETANEAKAVAAKLSKRLLATPHLPNAFKDKLRGLCAEYHIKLGNA